MDKDVQVYNAAKKGNFDEVKRLVDLKADINMVIMGAEDGKQEIMDTTDEKQKEIMRASIEKQKEIKEWAFKNGACFLFGFQSQSHQAIASVMKYNKNISMLKGPGDVPRGTFKKE